VQELKEFRESVALVGAAAVRKSTSQKVSQVTPAWIQDGFKELLRLYRDTILLEEAYKYFKDNYDKKDAISADGESYQERIRKGTLAIVEARIPEGAATGAGAVQDLEAAVKALGVVEHDESGKYVGGTNWMESKTSWRRFGLITGYNMQFNFKGPISMEPKRGDPDYMKSEAWQKHKDRVVSAMGGVRGKLRWAPWNAFIDLVGTGTAMAGLLDDAEMEASSHARWATVFSPRYFTGVGGASEPGISADTTEGNDAFLGSKRGRGPEVGLPDINLSKVGWPQGGLGSEGKNLFAIADANRGSRLNADEELITGWGGAEPWAFFGGPPRHSQPRIHPIYGSMGIEINKFYQNRSPDKDSGLGHFLSPEYVFYLRGAAGAGGAGAAMGKIGEALQNLRTNLVQRAKNIEPYDVAFATGRGISINTKFWNDDGPSGEYRFREGREIQLPAGPKWDLPDRVAIWPTLPLERPHTLGEQWHWGIRPADILAETWKGLYGHERDKDAENRGEGSQNEGREITKNAWIDVYSTEQAWLNVDLALRSLSVMKPESVLGTPGTDDYKAKMATNIERILDFFGAGRAAGLTGAQQREKAVTAGGDRSVANLADIDAESLKVISGFRSLKPFDLQCFLMENVAILVDYHRRKRKPQDPGGFKNVVKLKGEPGEVVSKLQHGAKTGAVKEMLNLTPAVYAALVPYIKIYRVDYDKDGFRPMQQIEMPIPNFMSPDDVAAITAGDYHRARGWGLQSFTWSLDGVQPAEVDNNISAKLQFYFQSVKDLFEGSAAAGEGGTTYAAGREKPSPLDLLIASPTVKAVKGNKKKGKDPEKDQTKSKKCEASVKDQVNIAADGKHYRIKVVAGWATPPSHVLKTLLPRKTTKELKQLITAINDTRIALYLQQTRHDLTFNQDGSVKLGIDYQAAISGMMTSNTCDILGPTSSAHKAKQDDLERQIDDAKATRDKRIARTGDAEGLKVYKESSEYKASLEEIKNLLESKKELLNEDKVYKYKRFLASLYGRSISLPDPESKGTQGVRMRQDPDAPLRIFTLVVPVHEAIKTPLHKIKDPEERRKRIEQRLGSTGDRGFILSDRPGAAGANIDLLGALNSDVKNVSLDAEAQARIENQAGETGTQMTQRLKSRSDGIYITYFYLGDLIDSIIGDNAVLGHGGDVSKMIKSSYITFLADMDITNPLLFYAAQNTDDFICADNIDDNLLIEQLRAKGLWKAGDGGVKKRINIGEIPISLDQFQIWFKNHVIKSQRNTYYLLHFIKDLCAYLITDSIKGACFESNVINDIRFDTSIIHFNNKKSASQVRIQPGQRDYSTDELVKAIGETTPENDIPDPNMTKEQRAKTDLTSGLVLYCTDASPRKRKGDIKADLEDGIYHHYLGSSVGLLKKMSFSREDQAMLREAKIQKFGALGAEQLRELYSVSLDLIGNTLFKNGQYTFIWPTSMAAGDDTMARLLGLGGYFLVTSVSHKISPSGYDVQIKALQQGLKFDDDPVPAESVPHPYQAKVDKKDAESKAEDEAAAVVDADTSADGTPQPTAEELEKKQAAARAADKSRKAQKRAAEQAKIDAAEAEMTRLRESLLPSAEAIDELHNRLRGENQALIDMIAGELGSTWDLKNPDGTYLLPQRQDYERQMAELRTAYDAEVAEVSALLQAQAAIVKELGG
jgi:hypothetical protein